MSKTSTARQLLIMALQDLRDAERAWSEQEATIAAAAGADVQRFLDADIARSGGQEKRLEQVLEGLCAPLQGDPNIWLRAVIDDAKRDIASIAGGPLRDTALVGALRKGKQAERVSYETALALASGLGREADVDALRRSRDEEAAADAALAALSAEAVRAG